MKKQIKNIFILSSLFLVLLFFQNCNPIGSSINANTSPSTELSGSRENLKAPVLTDWPKATVTLYSGLTGSLSGTVNIDSLTVAGHAGDGEEHQIITVRCSSSDDRLNLNCNNRQLVNGKNTFRIRPDNDQECISGQATITLFLEDIEPGNPESAVLQSNTETFKVNIVNNCLPENKIYPNTQSSQDNFGSKIVINGNYAAIASPFDDRVTTNAGAVEIFKKVNNQWQFMQKISLNDSTDNNRIESIALDGNNLAIGNAFGNSGRGNVHMFELQGSNWVDIQTLVPHQISNYPNDQFGFAVALSGSTLAVGTNNDSQGSQTASGSVYIFNKVGLSWNFTQKIMPASLPPFAQFGSSIDLEASTLIVGAPENFPGYQGLGKLYVFEKNGSWQEVAALEGGTGNHNTANFASSVALSGTTIVAGAPNANGKTNNSGAAYVYTFSNGAWALTQKLISSDGQSGNELGYSVSISGDDILLGARRESRDIYRKGAAYHYKKKSNGWQQVFKLMARDRESNDYFGAAVSVEAGAAMVGAPLDDGEASAVLPGLGAVYFYQLK